MNDLYTRLTTLCEEKGVTRYKMCRDTHLQPSFFTDLKSGRQKGMSPQNAAKLSEYFGVPVEYILYGNENKKPVTESDGVKDDFEITDKDKLFLEWFRSLSPEKQKAILISQDAPEELL